MITVLTVSFQAIRAALFSLLTSIPLAYHFMHNRLLNYDYQAPLSWWIFGVAAFGALAITLVTVSAKKIKKNLRS